MTWLLVALLAQAEAPPASDAPSEPAPESTPHSAGPRRHNHSARTERDLDLDAPCDADCVEQGDHPQLFSGLRHPVMDPRRPGLAMGLGFVVGFGTSYYYAGEAKRGVVFSVIDLALGAGLVASTAALTDLVVKHDFRSGKSLARNERSFGTRETGLYAASWGFGLLLLGSHVWQGVGGFRAARATNAWLEHFTVVPLVEGGATVELAL